MMNPEDVPAPCICPLGGWEQIVSQVYTRAWNRVHSDPYFARTPVDPTTIEYDRVINALLYQPIVTEATLQTPASVNRKLQPSPSSFTNKSTLIPQTAPPKVFESRPTCFLTRVRKQCGVDPGWKGPVLINFSETSFMSHSLPPTYNSPKWYNDCPNQLFSLDCLAKKKTSVGSHACWNCDEHSSHGISTCSIAITIMQ